MNTKKTTIISMIALCLGTVSTCSGVQFWFYENGVPTTEPTVVEEFEVVQNAFPYGAYDLHFKVWQKEDNIDIIGWDIHITRFTDGTAKREKQPEPAHSTSTPSGEDPDNGRHAVDVSARFFPVLPDPNNPFDPNAPLYPYEPYVPYGGAVKVTIKLWLTSWNTIRIADAVWTNQFGFSKPADIPDHGWSIGFPVALPVQPGQFAHKMSFFNDGDDPIFLSDIQYMPSLENYADFNDLFIEASLQVPEMESLVLQGGMSTDSNDIPTMDILTEGDFIDNFIYHTFKIGRFAGDPNAMVITARHLVVREPQPNPTLSEWGLIIMAVLLVSAGAIVIWRRQRIVA
jgi:hypothetical protein